MYVLCMRIKLCLDVLLFCEATLVMFLSAVFTYCRLQLLSFLWIRTVICYDEALYSNFSESNMHLGDIVK